MGTGCRVARRPSRPSSPRPGVSVATLRRSETRLCSIECLAQGCCGALGIAALQDCPGNRNAGHPGSHQFGTVPGFDPALGQYSDPVPYMQKSGINFTMIFDYCHSDNQEELAKRAPVHEVLLDMAVSELPSPAVAQPYRIPNIWQGDPDSEVGKAMIGCDAAGPLALMITKIWMDPHAGEVAVGRIFSGTVEQGDTLWASGAGKPERVQQVSMMVGADRIPVESVVAGNIVAITGIRSAAAGVTITREQDSTPFEEIRHYSEPVVTVAIEPKAMKDLPKFIDALRSLAKADASLEVSTNSETGEALLAGMGELQIGRAHV